jgi:hypothetical protein
MKDDSFVTYKLHMSIQQYSMLLAIANMFDSAFKKINFEVIDFVKLILNKIELKVK